MSALNVVMIGPFGFRPRTTMRVRALPLAQALVRRGHRVSMLLPPWQNPEDAGRAWCEGGVHIENMRLPRGVPGWFHGRLTAQLIRRTRALNPDVVHVFKPKAYAGLAHLGLQGRFPVVVDTDDWEGPGGWNALADYPSWMKRFFTWQERWGLSRARAVTVASRALQTLVWSLGEARERVFYLPNGVEPATHPRDPLDHPRPTMLLYTRFFEYGLDRLWRVVHQVRSRCPEARLIVVGQGFAGEEQALMERARHADWQVVTTATSDMDADLLYVGWGTEATLAWSFGMADVALYPFDDTLLNRTKCPMKLMDLLVRGIPVVADAVGQIAEVIIHGETGWLVEVGDDAAFAEGVVRLLTDAERRQQMGHRARSDVSARYAWDTLVDAASAAYHYARSG